MEIIKRKILLENSISRTSGSTYGTLVAKFFYIKVLLTQDIDDMGIFSDVDYTPKLGDVLYNPDTTFSLRLPEHIEASFYKQGDKVTGTTETKINDLLSYSKNSPLILNFDINTELYENFTGNSINGVDRITGLNDPITYVVDTDKNDSKIGTIDQNSGILYQDFSGSTKNDGNLTIQLSKFSVNSEGWNKTNISLSALTKEEYLFGITSVPIIENDVFIDRGSTNLIDFHLRLSEINNLDELTSYNNGFYNIEK